MGGGILINGETADPVSALDRGLQYGDGVFETIAVRGGHPAHWRRHLRRLHEGCSRLGITSPDDAVLLRDAEAVCRGVDRAVLKIIVTRGVGGRGYRPGDSTPTSIVSISDWPDYPEDWNEIGVWVRWCDLRLGRNPALAGIKHLNRLEQVLAQREWDHPDIAEGLMLDSEGEVIEGTKSNVFTVREEKLLTPSLTHCGVAGIMRELILEQAERAGIKHAVMSLRQADVEAAQEIFLCNSLIGIWPVRQLGERELAVGPITRQLQSLVDVFDAKSGD